MLTLHWPKPHKLTWLISDPGEAQHSKTKVQFLPNVSHFCTKVGSPKLNHLYLTPRNYTLNSRIWYNLCYERLRTSSPEDTCPGGGCVIHLAPAPAQDTLTGMCREPVAQAAIHTHPQQTHTSNTYPNPPPHTHTPQHTRPPKRENKTRVARALQTVMRASLSPLCRGP